MRACRAVIRGYEVHANGHRRQLFHSNATVFRPSTRLHQRNGVDGNGGATRTIGGFGGFPGGGGGGSNDTKYYDLLGVSRDADQNEIKKAFRKAAMKHHPDQGGDMAKFKEIKNAYEILSDEQKRAAYDQFGEAGVDESMGGGGGGFPGGVDPNDIFSQFFGGQQTQRPRPPPKTDNINTAVQLTLEELYEGTTKELRFNKTVLCGTCDGLGASSTKGIKTCGTCNGSGYVVQTRQLGPMLQQVQSICPSCGGEGKTIDAAHRCGACNGTKVQKKRKELEVTIKPGLEHGQKLVLRGEADEAPDQEPGDIILTIQEKPHPSFQRVGSNLLYKHTLSLSEALTGYKVPLVLVCGKTQTLESIPGEVVSPGDLRALDNAGMPILGKTKGNTSKEEEEPPRGQLFVQFDVEMPDSLTEDQQELITQALGKKEVPGRAKAYEAVTLKKVSRRAAEQALRKGQRGGGRSQRHEEEGGSCSQM
eukprot:g3467.t1